MRDWSPVPEKPHGRIIFFSVVLFGTMVYYHWEAMIISYLSMRTIRLPFNSLEELLSNTEFKVAYQSYIF